MQNVEQNINLIPNEPELKDLLDYFGKQIKLDVNCHHIGTITSFDPTTQTAQASINYTKTKQQVDSVGDVTIVNIAYPLLIDCPVICLGGGGGGVTFPITAGDECLILFNDRDLDNWFSGSSNSAPATGRLHAFPDAVILVGLRSLANVIPDYDADSSTLFLGANYVKVKPDKIEILFNNNKITVGSDNVDILLSNGNEIVLYTTEVIVNIGATTSLTLTTAGKLQINNGTGEFVGALSQLFTDIQTGLVTTMLGPMPLVMPTFTTDLAVFNSFKA